MRVQDSHNAAGHGFIQNPNLLRCNICKSTRECGPQFVSVGENAAFQLCGHQRPYNWHDPRAHRPPTTPGTPHQEDHLNNKLGLMSIGPGIGPSGVCSRAGVAADAAVGRAAGHRRQCTRPLCDGTRPSGGAVQPGQCA
eukprot:EG_transcript_17339